MDSISIPVFFGQFTEIVPSETSSITVGQGAFSKISVIVIMHLAMTPLPMFGVGKGIRTSGFFYRAKSMPMLQSGTGLHRIAFNQIISLTIFIIHLGAILRRDVLPVSGKRQLS